MMITFPTKPDSRAIDPACAAAFVVDGQNAFRSPGERLDLSGIDIRGAQSVIQVLAEVFDAGRRAGFLVVACEMGYDAELASSDTLLFAGIASNLCVVGWTLTVCPYVDAIHPHLLREARV